MSSYEDYKNGDSDYTAPDQLEDLDIDLSKVEADSSIDAIPPGTYQMQAIEVKVVHSKAGNRVVKVQFQVIGGTYDNRRVFENFNIQHDNPKVVEIALRQLKSWIAAASGNANAKLTMALLQSLEGAEFLGTVKVEEDKSGQYQPQNRLKVYKALPGAAPAPAATPAPRPAATPRPPVAAPRPTAAPTKSKMNGDPKPWERPSAAPAQADDIPF